MTEPIRWGVLATGGIARKFVTDLRQVPDARVVAVGSRTADAAEDFAAAHGVDRAYGTWRELAADPDVDIVYVATPHSHHHVAAELCLRAGKHVLVEKPITLDLAQAQDLVTLARERNLFLMEAMWMRTLPAMVKLRQHLARGAIGKVTSIQASFGLGMDIEPEHRLRDPALGGGALLDLGVYAVHFAHMILGAPRQIRALAHLHPEGTDARTGIILGFSQGEIATLYCGVSGLVGRAMVVGTEGSIEIPEDFYNATRFVLRRGGSEPEWVTGDPAGLHHQAAEAGRCLRAGLTESAMVPIQSTLDVMGTMDAVRAQIGVSY